MKWKFGHLKDLVQRIQLQELLTIKSDDMRGRNLAFMSIIRGNLLPKPGVPESFKVLVCELRGLCLDISLARIPSV